MALLALVPAPALAQAYQCSIPERIAPVEPVRPDGPVRKVPVAGYTLAVSWSPEYCRGARDRDSMQCSGRNGRFGFVLHGLWPEAAAGPPPQWCALLPRPSVDTVRRSLCTTPVPWLIEHEWAKHGSCMATTPEAYWAIARHVYARFQWPDAAKLSFRPGLTVGALRQAVIAANPGLKREAIGVLVSSTGWLRELRICHNRQYRPVACQRDTLGPADSRALKIWRGA
nr:ribonuclease T [Novosphingobium flavum]